MARRFTLNEFKIKKGFKQLYGQSGFSMIQDLRMQKAMELLRSGEANVEEASLLVGYSSIHKQATYFLK